MRFPRLEVTADQIESIVILSNIPPSSLQPSSPATTRIETPTWQQSTPSPSKGKFNRKAQPSDWSKEDVRRYKSEEFDFQHNLGLFDKKKIFSEIRQQDETRPEERLVAHNLSQRKLGHDQNVLSGRTEDADGGDKIVMETNERPSAGMVGKIPFVERSVIESIEQKILLSGAISNEQVIENGGRSVCEFLFKEESKLLSAPGGVLLALSADKLGAYALCAGRHILNRNIRVSAMLPSDMRLAPTYFNAALRQFQKCGGIIYENGKEKISLVISSSSTPSAFGKARICSLVAGTAADWNICFGLPAKEGSTCVLCDVGWPANIVDPMLGDRWQYHSTFGFASYIIVRDK